MYYITTFFSLQGRINRKPFWIGFVILFAIEFALLVSMGTLMIMAGATTGGAQVDFANDPSMKYVAVIILVSLVIFYCSFALFAKRIHDLGNSAWFFMIVFIPVIGWGWLLLEAGLFQGEKGPNKFGPDPLAN